MITHAVTLQRHTISQRLFWLLAVSAIHAVIFLELRDGFVRSTPRPLAHAMLVTAFIQPMIRDEGTPTSTPDLSALVMRVRTSLTHIEQPEIIFDVSRNNAATSAAPSIKDGGRDDMAPFIKQAALLPGEGVTVVLRIEVLETGEPGRIEIDASSGSRQVDEAAIGYARTRRWYAGRSNGSPQPMWIRWGVRLQA